jgi:hypothetical protein
MDALAKLQELYKLRDTTNDQIEQIETILGAAPGETKTKRTRGPNKPKETAPPANAL